MQNGVMAATRALLWIAQRNLDLLTEERWKAPMNYDELCKRKKIYGSNEKGLGIPGYGGEWMEHSRVLWQRPGGR